MTAMCRNALMMNMMYFAHERGVSQRSLLETHGCQHGERTLEGIERLASGYKKRNVSLYVKQHLHVKFTRWALAPSLISR